MYQTHRSCQLSRARQSPSRGIFGTPPVWPIGGGPPSGHRAVWGDGRGFWRRRVTRLILWRGAAQIARSASLLTSLPLIVSLVSLACTITVLGARYADVGGVSTRARVAF